MLGVLVALATAWSVPNAALAQQTEPLADRTSAAPGAPEAPQSLTAAQARDLVARMSDQEARDLLLKQLEALGSTVQTQPEPEPPASLSSAYRPACTP